METNHQTKLNITLVVTRFTLALVVMAHGAQKLLGWFGGYGFEGTMGFFTETIGLPYFLGVIIILVESIGMVALAIGLGSRWLAGFVVVLMLGAIFSVHLPHGFFMNWSGMLKGEGYEFHLLAIALAIPTILFGGGKFALDNLMKGKAI